MAAQTDILTQPLRTEAASATPTGVAKAVRVSQLEYLHGCPLCGDEELRHYCRVPSLFNPGEFIRYDVCGGCGIVLRNPRTPASDRLVSYEDRALPDAFSFDDRARLHWRLLADRLHGLAPGVGTPRLLDFGCGAGGFLLEARAAGFAVHGLELNRALAQHVERTHQIPVYSGLIGDPAFAHERFEVIASTQVFEHLLDPRHTLMELRRHLVPGGVIMIEVPNLRDIRERLWRGSTMDDSHLFYFSRRSLSHALTSAQFEVLEVHEGLRPHRLIPGITNRLPRSLLRAAERVLSACQIKTSLGVIARLRPEGAHDRD